MRKIIYILMIGIVALTIISACTDVEDFLDTKPKSEYSSADFWYSPGLVRTFINGIYKDLFGDPYSYTGVHLSCFSGNEAWFNEGLSTSEFNKCLITSDQMQGWTNGESLFTRQMRWVNFYQTVRKTNLFFSEMKDVEYTNPLLKDFQMGEVYFLRGFVYHLLTSFHGGVPIISKVFNLDDDFQIPRNTYEESIDFIIGQLDSAAIFLPEIQDATNAGRVTKGAALALKSRVLLYAASDLHHNMSFYAPTYENPELLGFVSADRTALWQKAKDAAKEVIDLGLYSLYKAEPAPNDSIAQNLKDYFLSRSETSEDILIQYTSELGGVSWNDYDPYFFFWPNGYHGWGGCEPTEDLVSAYERKDGSSFDWNNPVHKASPYDNREARFYSDILYEGAPWSIRPEDIRGIDPFNRLQTGYVNYIDDQGKPQVFVGADAGLIDDWSGGLYYTGYFYHKCLDPNVDYTKKKQDVPFRLFRYAEILLNYAEACIELDQYEEAKTYINMIRKRAGQPDITETGDALRERYRHERRIEMAFEGQYFFDLRRWLIGSIAHQPIHRVITTYTTNQNIEGYLKPDGSYWSTPEYSLEVLDNYTWDDKAYFFPITRDEVNKNSKLIQNPGY